MNPKGPDSIAQGNALGEGAASTLKGRNNLLCHNSLSQLLRVWHRDCTSTSNSANGPGSIAAFRRTGKPALQECAGWTLGGMQVLHGIYTPNTEGRE